MSPPAVCILLISCVLSGPQPALAGGDPSDTAVIVLGGDVQHGRYRFKTWETHAGSLPLADIASIWGDADLMVANLENPLTDTDPPDILRLRERPWRNIRLRGPTSAARALRQEGVDVATFANNHTLDCGRSGVEDTLAALREAGVATAGVSLEGDPLDPAIVEAGAARVYVFAATRTSNRRVSGSSPLARLSYEEMRAQLVPRMHAVRTAEPGAVILVALHWGTEWSFAQDPPQARIARELIDAGAHVVVGHHPHLVQPVEAYGDGLVIYSIGNLLFDQPSVGARHSAVARVSLRRSNHEWRVERVELHAIYRDLRRPGPELADETARRRLLERVRKSSFATGTRLLWDGEYLKWQRPPELAVGED